MQSPALSFRISGRLGWTRPDMARFLAGRGLDLLDAPAGLAPRALRDIKAGQAAGRFTLPDAEIALNAVAGGLLALLRLPERHPEHAGPGSRRPGRRRHAAHARDLRGRSRAPGSPPAARDRRLVMTAGPLSGSPLS